MNKLDKLIAQKEYELDCLRSYRDIIDHHYLKNALQNYPELRDNESMEEMTKEEARVYFIDSNEKIISVAKDENRYNYETQQIEDVFMRRDFEAKELAIKALEQQTCEDVGELSDGYHTFNQLYHQRAVLFACIVKQNKNKAWKSFKHSDGKYCFDSNGEWFIVGVDTPQGSYTYHYAKEYWDMFDCQELECGKEWDGHTEEDVTRLLSLPYIENDDED